MANVRLRHFTYEYNHGIAIHSIIPYNKLSFFSAFALFALFLFSHTKFMFYVNLHLDFHIQQSSKFRFCILRCRSIINGLLFSRRPRLLLLFSHFSWVFSWLLVTLNVRLSTLTSPSIPIERCGCVKINPVLDGFYQDCNFCSSHSWFHW